MKQMHQATFRHILLVVLKTSIAAVDSCETAQEIWLRVQQMMKGSGYWKSRKEGLKLFNDTGKEWANWCTEYWERNVVAARAEGTALGIMSLATLLDQKAKPKCVAIQRMIGPSASKSSCIKNKEVEVEEHHRNLLLSKNKKHMSSECKKHVKVILGNDQSEVIVLCMIVEDIGEVGARCLKRNGHRETSSSGGERVPPRGRNSLKILAPVARMEA
ncbi:hypothetical protein Tco_0682374 [Tanacetum coccineum]|uniref:Uncharacterized protein n=1 Tax=Tanacetum coccineum TaxID=301880 RepID=A0ABQ4XQZ8_9ASTR